jgi:hypothetical protein
MANSFASVLPPPPVHKKSVARTALVDIHDPTRALLTECFRQFGIQTVVMSSDAADRLKTEKFAACVLPLHNGAEAVMEAARGSASNSRCIIYAIGGDAQHAMRFSRYGINAFFQEPIERPTALKLVRSTHNLVLHEFRRYVRIPVMTEVSIVCADSRRFSASSVEMSSGGMSLKTTEDVTSGTNVDVSFSLMTLPRVWVRGVVTWKKPKSFGVRFDPTDDRRHKIKQWIDSYLEI